MKRILALLLALSMIFVFTACMKSEEQKRVEEATDRLESIFEDVDETEASSAAEVLGDYADAVSDAGGATDVEIDEYVDTLVKTDNWKNTVETWGSQGLSIEVEARGNSLVYVYTYTVAVDVAVAKETLESNRESMKSTADSLRKILTKLDTVICEYYDIDGNLIYTIEC